MSKKIRILMVGPDDTVMGGMTSVQQIYRHHWDYEAIPLQYVGIYSAGSKLRKFVVAIIGLLIFSCYLIFWRPHIVHVHFSWKAGFYRESVFMLLARLFQTIIIAHAHAPDFDSFYRAQPGFAQAYICFVMKHLSQLIVLSEIWRTYYCRFIPKDRITILHNPAEIPEIETVTRQKRLILFLGELGIRKGIYDLLKAIPLVTNAQPDIEFYLCGNGDISQVTHIIKNGNLARHVHMQGWVRGQAKHQLLSDATMLVLPSYSEGLPMSVIEAMMYRVPVITTPVGSIPDLFTDGVNVLLIEAGHIDQLSATIQKLLLNEELQVYLAENAYQLARNGFACDEILKQLYAHYQRLIS